MRLGGIFLSLATLAFAFFFDQVVLQLGWVGARHADPRRAPARARPDRLQQGRQGATSCCTLVDPHAREHRGDLGARAAPPAATSTRCAAARSRPSSIGINRTPGAHRRVRAVGRDRGAGRRADDLVHAPGHGVEHRLAYFVPELGLAWIVLVVTLGSRTVEGAINAAVGFVFFQAVVLPTWIPWRGQPRAARVPHDVAAGRAAADPVRARRAHVRQAPRGHPRVPEAPFVRAHAAAHRTSSAARARPARPRPTSPAARASSRPAGSGS